MTLRSYVVGRVLLTIPMIVLLFTFVFLILRLLPGDPVLLHFEKPPDPATIELYRHQLGLDKPLYQQYIDYLIGIFHGDFGKSMTGDFEPVSYQIQARFPATLELTIYSMIFAVVVGVFLGVRSAKTYGSLQDNTIRIFGTITYAIPVFFLGMILQFIFAIWLGVLPPLGRFDIGQAPPHVTGLYTIDSILAGDLYSFVTAVRYLILPTITLGTVLCGIFIRLTRTNMLETLKLDFVDAAKARGLSDNAITYRYALKNAFLPILTMIGLQFAALLAGAVLTEITFSWEGLGSFLFEKISQRDYTAIQGTVVFFGILVTMVTLVLDLLYAYLDPRIRF
ncbi:MAG: ABC transporter permease [Candidatus Thorarchaeota archaeon]|nr:ABC transporter permease [Candidatus Thorarchaeota archaeon]